MEIEKQGQTLLYLTRDDL